MLIALHKHLYSEPLFYLTRLIFQIDINAQNEQILQLSALLTKFLWSSMIDIDIDPDVATNSKRSINKERSPIVFQPLLGKKQARKKKASNNNSSSSTTTLDYDYEDCPQQVQPNRRECS